MVSQRGGSQCRRVKRSVLVQDAAGPSGYAFHVAVMVLAELPTDTKSTGYGVMVLGRFAKRMNGGRDAAK